MATGSSIEQWRKFRGGEYEVSDLGNVRRRDGLAKKSSKSGNGYMIFGAFINKFRINVLVHRAVLECFVGPCPTGKEVNHKNGNKSDNRLCNLEYVTRSENSIHALKSGLSKPPTERANGDDHWTRKHPELLKRGDENGSRLHPERILRGSKCKSAKLNEVSVKAIKNAIASGIRSDVIASNYGVTREAINAIKSGKSWRHVQ